MSCNVLPSFSVVIPLLLPPFCSGEASSGLVEQSLAVRFLLTAVSWTLRKGMRLRTLLLPVFFTDTVIGLTFSLHRMAFLIYFTKKWIIYLWVLFPFLLFSCWKQRPLQKAVMVHRVVSLESQVDYLTQACALCRTKRAFPPPFISVPHTLSTDGAPKNLCTVCASSGEHTVKLQEIIFHSS